MSLPLQWPETTIEEGNRQGITNGCSSLPLTTLSQNSQAQSKKDETHLLLQAVLRVLRGRVLSSAFQKCQVSARGLRAVLGAIGAAAVAAAEAAAQRLGVQLQSMPHSSVSKTTQIPRQLQLICLQDNCRNTQQHNLLGDDWWKCSSPHSTHGHLVVGAGDSCRRALSPAQWGGGCSEGGLAAQLHAARALPAWQLADLQLAGCRGSRLHHRAPVAFRRPRRASPQRSGCYAMLTGHISRLRAQLLRHAPAAIQPRHNIRAPHAASHGAWHSAWRPCGRSVQEALPGVGWRGASVIWQATLAFCSVILPGTGTAMPTQTQHMSVLGTG